MCLQNVLLTNKSNLLQNCSAPFNTQMHTGMFNGKEGKTIFLSMIEPKAYFFQTSLETSPEIVMYGIQFRKYCNALGKKLLRTKYNSSDTNTQKKHSSRAHVKNNDNNKLVNIMICIFNNP